MPINWNDVLHRARLAAAVYPAGDSATAWKEIEQAVRALGYSRFEAFDADGTQAFLCANAGEVCFVFRGSDDLADWVRNLKFTRRTVLRDSAGQSLGRVHRGFLQAADAIAKPLVSRIRDWMAKHPNRRLHGVGHSLGAACAAMVALRSLRDLRPRLTLFGSPRIGNRRFAREFNFTLGDRTLAIRHRNDIVTLSPFWNRAIGRLWYLTGDGRAIADPPRRYRAWQQVKANAKWTANVALRWLSNGLLGSPPALLEQVSDHFMRNYLAAVERVAVRHEQDSQTSRELPAA